MKKILTYFIVIFVGISLVGCSSNQDVGTVTGGVLGGLIGSRFGGGTGQLVAIGAGAVVGAYLGGRIGKTMDQQDQARMQAALEQNNVGQPAYWTNQRSGNSYTVVPVRNVTVQSNRYCREYRTTANIAGKQQQIYGTACRQPDGSWKVVK